MGSRNVRILWVLCVFLVSAFSRVAARGLLVFEIQKCHQNVGMSAPFIIFTYPSKPSLLAESNLPSGYRGSFHGKKTSLLLLPLLCSFVLEFSASQY